MGAGRSSGQRWQGSPSRLRVVTFIHTCIRAKLLQLCLTLWDPRDCSMPGSSVHGVLQARILEWVAISFPRRSSRPRDQTRVSCRSCNAGGFFTAKPPEKPDLFPQI